MNSGSGESPASEIVLWAEYPSGQYQAVVQSDGRTVYLIIQDAGSDTPPRLCWVRNLVPGPLVIAKPESDGGRPPLMPETYCNHPKGAAEPNWDDCRIYWFPQGLGAALFEKDELLALIPPLPDQGLPGFARDCLHPTSVALPLDDDDHYAPQVSRLAAYWEMWAQSPPWPRWQQALEAEMQKVWGTPTQHYAPPQAVWPPIAVTRWETQEHCILTTAGMGLRPQVGVEKDLQNFQDHQQAELAIEIPLNRLQAPSDVDDYVQWLAGLARYPWHHQTCFLPGHTISIPPELSKSWGSEMARFDPESQLANSQQRSAILLPSFANQPVNLLWLRPKDS